ncbi:MAG TPA: hypothetical protein VJB87_04850 [Candidatus Nanoarchaeia archaeon]|nr:hypothetical protein [Candidatus Nanoarchaeia archaeon]
MVENLHKKAAVIILLIVIVLSALGTWTVLEATSIQRRTTAEDPFATGKVSIGIIPLETTEGAQTNEP